VTQKSSSTRLLLSAFVLFAINVLNFYDRHVPGALTEPIRKEFHLTDTQIGLLGSAFIWIYALIGLPLGRIADSASRKKLLAVAILIWSSLTASAAFAGSFTMLLFSRIGVGIGEAGCAPAATSWLGDLFSAGQALPRPRPVHVGRASRRCAQLLLQWASSPGLRLACRNDLGRRSPRCSWFPALLLLPEPKRGASEICPAPLVPSSTWTILRIPTLWWIIASGALLNFNMYAIATFLPAFLSRVHGLSLASSGTVSGVVYITGGLTGCALAGYVGDAAIRRRKDGRLRIAALTSLAAAPLACFGVLQPAGSLLAAVIFLTLTYSLLTSYYGPRLFRHSGSGRPQPARCHHGHLLHGHVHVRRFLRAAAHGRLSDFLAHRAAAQAGSATVTEALRAVGLQQAMLIIPVLSVALAAVLFAGSRTMATDAGQREPAATSAAAVAD